MSRKLKKTDISDVGQMSRGQHLYNASGTLSEYQPLAAGSNLRWCVKRTRVFDVSAVRQAFLSLRHTFWVYIYLRVLVLGQLALRYRRWIRSPGTDSNQLPN